MKDSQVILILILAAVLGGALGAIPALLESSHRAEFAQEQSVQGIKFTTEGFLNYTLVIDTPLRDFDPTLCQYLVDQAATDPRLLYILKDEGFHTVRCGEAERKLP
jgi:hypothetical protein